MGSREGSRERGGRRGVRIVQELAREWRGMRLSAGVAQRDVARAVGISREVYGQMERGQGRDIGIARAAAISAVLGADLSVKVFPTGVPIHDVAHDALLNRFGVHLHPVWRRQREAPVGIAGDLRAWDERLDGPVSIGVEAETRPHDLQALERRMNVKQRDSGVQRMILLVAGTERNRRVMRELRPALRATFPLSTHEVLEALRHGRDPGANGVVLL